MRQAGQWALDEVDYCTEVTTMESVDQCRAAPPKRMSMACSGMVPPWTTNMPISRVGAQTLIAPLPVLFVSGLCGTRRSTTVELFGKHGPYECPVYKYPPCAATATRATPFGATRLSSTCGAPKCTVEKPKNHRSLRGVALLANAAAPARRGLSFAGPLPKWVCPWSDSPSFLFGHCARRQHPRAVAGPALAHTSSQIHNHHAIPRR